MNTNPNPNPDPDPEMVRQCLEAYAAGETFTTEELLADCRQRREQQEVEDARRRKG